MPLTKYIDDIHILDALEARIEHDRPDTGPAAFVGKSALRPKSAGRNIGNSFDFTSISASFSFCLFTLRHKIPFNKKKCQRVARVSLTLIPANKRFPLCSL